MTQFPHSGAVAYQPGGARQQSSAATTDAEPLAEAEAEPQAGPQAQPQAEPETTRVVVEDAAGDIAEQSAGDVAEQAAGDEASDRAVGGADATPGEADPAEADAVAGGTDPSAGRRAGETTIADEVVEKVAAIAVRAVPGVHDLGSDGSRLFHAVRERIGLGETRGGRGISVKLTGRTATVAVNLVVEYGNRVYDVADQVRESVADAVETMLGIEVTGVDIVVDDVHVPEG